MRHALLYLRPWKRHSMVVGMGGCVYLVYGVYFALTPLTDERTAALRVALTLPVPWGLVWVGVGFLALISTRWPPASETWGYTALTSLAAAWALFYASGMLVGAPVGSGLGGVLVWGLVGFRWWGIAGLRNPDDIVLRA